MKESNFKNKGEQNIHKKCGSNNNINRNSMVTNTGQSPTPSIDPYGDDDDDDDDDDGDNDHFPHKSNTTLPLLLLFHRFHWKKLINIMRMLQKKEEKIS